MLQCLQSLGYIQCMLNHYNSAMEMLTSDQTKFEGIGSQLGVVQFLQSLGDIQQMLSHYDSAQEILPAAETKFEGIVIPWELHSASRALVISNACSTTIILQRDGLCSSN